ncbi:IclR family transcriptional regulator [Halopelagius longus]|uniref:IclR family transcriptional regulator n=1 Tax=Halopelagius longus TaxID=1236180 RepID=A0A1H1FDI6_9EURY|nr:IclR family transcriptional regulator [Halopelagius longus]RDI70152.1 IclR family transcriptional regulator [Halopelagius longus]SDQ99022.1 transcriptional regulator, IclR family [Halopelagius longus]
MNLDIPGDDGKRVSAVQRAFEVIGVLRESGTVRIKDVAAELDIPTSTAHVHLKTLESVGYVVRDEDGYRLGLRFLRDGSVARNGRRVYSTAKSEVDGVADSTGEVANLGVEENGQRVIVYQSEGSEAVYDNALVGEFTNMHWTALGKAILAELPEEYVTQIVEHYGLPAATENTIDDAETLFAELTDVRNRGYALEDEERRAGIRSIAIPILVDGGVIGAVSLSGPKERFDADRIDEELLPALKDCRNVVEVKTAYE